MNTNIAEQALADCRDFAGAGDLVAVQGLSSPRVCQLLNELVARMDPGEHYLEIGTWRGKTLLSAAYGNRGRSCVGCDKFRLFGRYTGFGFLARHALSANLSRYREQAADIRVYAVRADKLFARGLSPSPIGVYFYDGDHSYEATRHGIVAAKPFLNDRAVIVMDDWRDPVIRRATFHGLREAGLHVLWHRALDANDPEPRAWWNGVGIFYVEHPARTVPAMRGDTR